MRGIVIGALMLLWCSPAVAEPWYERPKCDQAEQLLLSGEFEQADRAIKQIETSHDNDDQACGVWLRMSLTEFQIAHLGRTPAMLAAQERMLGRMFGFAKAHERLAIRFHDIEMEARLRKIRVLFAAEKRSDAVKEAQRVRAMLDERRSEPITPTYDFVSGNVNSVLAYSAWPIRTLLKLGGISGDGAVGQAALKKLLDGKSIYRFEAIYVSRHFAGEDPEHSMGKASAYSAQLRTLFPTNPAFVFDYASDLLAEGSCTQALEVVGPMVSSLKEQPTRWTAPVRAKLYWVSGACQLALGHKSEALRLAQLARDQNFEELLPDIEKVESGAKS